jgi:hypothetical protein
MTTHHLDKSDDKHDYARRTEKEIRDRGVKKHTKVETK